MAEVYVSKYLLKGLIKYSNKVLNRYSYIISCFYMSSKIWSNGYIYMSILGMYL